MILDDHIETVADELRHIPRGSMGSSQNFLRRHYSGMRKTSLSNGDEPKKEEILLLAIDRVKETDPAFLPEYDPDFFSIRR